MSFDWLRGHNGVKTLIIEMKIRIYQGFGIYIHLVFPQRGLPQCERVKTELKKGASKILSKSISRLSNGAKEYDIAQNIFTI